MSERQTPGLLVTPASDGDRQRRSNAPTQESPAKRRRLTRHNGSDDEDIKPVIHIQTAVARKEARIIEIPDGDEEVYFLREFDKVIPKHEVVKKLTIGYARIFEQQFAQARTTELQRQMDIVSKVVRVMEISHILENDEKEWFGLLEAAGTALKQEHKQIIEFCGSIKREETRLDMEREVMVKVEARCDKINKALALREKIVKEMRKWNSQ